MRYILIHIIFVFSNLSALSQDDKDYKTLLENTYKGTVELITSSDLALLMRENKSLYIIDTRERSEFNVSTIKGAFSINELLKSNSALASISKSDTVIVYCTIGARSEDVGKQLMDLGYQNVYNLYGGIISWKNEGNPVFKNGRETENIHVYSKEWGIWLKNGKAVY